MAHRIVRSDELDSVCQLDSRKPLVRQNRLELVVDLPSVMNIQLDTTVTL